ncbi:MAG: type II toxin-antitoxin system PemK/MazF family toxin [Acidobacteria bacterium]|nr:MAG: type II toxin-antitoxin system PemK/MazF family toxin [Acidobacteriota bacterium]
MVPVRRGDIWWVSFDAAQGGGVRKTRPAVVISNNISNTILNRVVVVPLSRQTEKIYPSEAKVNAAGVEAKAMADQITSAAKTRLLRLGRLENADLRGVEQAILLHLGIHR